MLFKLLGAYSTRTFTCTLLSFMAKFGANPSVRKLLGYHLDREETSVATYSRDTLSLPLRELVTMLSQVKQGLFMPDQNRSGYFPAQSSLSKGTFPLSAPRMWLQRL